MRLMRAHVKGGQLVLDEPAGLPEGASVEIAVLDPDELDADERAALDAAISIGHASLREQGGIPAADVLREIDALS